ncbi:unnamed protein product [Rotaria sp. Silwood1]|nr:unnamed protein product [Rotaria sp. Silwood1]CAF3702366.1 unnamed protein product [Rotaria sp. Silwood1]CAF3773591.1 unnamed protein product [Rotaria sp. Silwood1]CAF4895104.1 unnamed protein product [Rotaria sp. Silwood1]
MISHLSVVNYNKTFQLYENNIITITILPQFSIVNQNEIDSSFMYTQLLKEILIEIEYDVTAKEQFIDYVHNFYANNEIQLNAINEFKHTYEHYSPIWWYTKELFIYSILNRVLRIQDIDIIMKMGFFIQDFHQQIKKIHSMTKHSSKMIVYRGQHMTKYRF